MHPFASMNMYRKWFELVVLLLSSRGNKLVPVKASVRGGVGIREETEMLLSKSNAVVTALLEKLRDEGVVEANATSNTRHLAVNRDMR